MTKNLVSKYMHQQTNKQINKLYEEKKSKKVKCSATIFKIYINNYQLLIIFPVSHLNP